jgi:Domain of unknown function (DUF397)
MDGVGSERGEGHWRTSSYSSAAGNCVEVRHVGDLVELRHSKHPDVVLVITRAEWRAFLDAVKRGDLDRKA